LLSPKGYVYNFVRIKEAKTYVNTTKHMDNYVSMTLKKDILFLLKKIYIPN